MNKKGAISDADKALFLTIFAMGGIIALVYFIFFMIPSLVNAHTGISPDLQRKIHMNTLISSPHCFAYQEPISRRTTNGYIDYNKINEHTLQECLRLDTKTEQGVFIEVFKKQLINPPLKEIHSRNALQKIGNRKTEYIIPIKLAKDNEFHNGILKFTFY